jgi:hypothetical protein
MIEQHCGMTEEHCGMIEQHYGTTKQHCGMMQETSEKGSTSGSTSVGANGCSPSPKHC